MIAFIVNPEGVIQVVLVTAGGIGRQRYHLLQATVRRARRPGLPSPKWQPGAETLISLDLGRL